MVQPINYLAQIPQPDLARSLASGLQLGMTVRQMREQQLAQEQAQVAKQQFADDLRAAQTEGTQAAWLRMIGKYPQFREAFDTVRKGVGEEQVKNDFFQGFEISNALENKNTDVASQRLRTIIEAKKASGQPTNLYEQALSQIEAGRPDVAQSGVNQILAILDPDKYKKTVLDIQEARQKADLQPEALRKLVAEADKAVSDAKSAQAAATTAAARERANLDRANAEARKAEVDARVARAEEQLTGGFKATEQIRNAEFYRNASPKQQEALENVVKLGRSTTEIIMPGETTGQKELAQAAPTWASQMRDAANITGDVNRYRKLLPKAITGTFADQRAAVARAFGFGAENLAATREVVRGLGRFVLNGRGKLEGQGSISNFEQEVIAKAESGDISLSPAELSTLFDAVERDARLLYQQNRSLFDNTKEAYPTVKIFEVLSKSVPKLPEPVRVEVPAPPAAPAPAPARPTAAAPAPAAPVAQRPAAPGGIPAGFGAPGPRVQSFAVTPQPGVRTQSLPEIFSGTSVAR